MALLYPDIIQHSNSNLAVVDSIYVRGGLKTVATKALLTSIPSDQANQFVTKAYVSSDTTTANNGWWTLLGGADSTNLANWQQDASTYSLPTASTSVLGGVKIDGTTITISGGVISAVTYSLPTATTSVLGGVKIDGTTITISGGVISSVSPITGMATNIIPKINGGANGLVASSITDNGTTVVITEDVTVSGTLTASSGGYDSDITLKKDIIYKPFISDIINLKAVSYRLNSNDEFHYGYIAQDVKEILPSAIITKANGLLAVQYHEVLVAKVSYLEGRLEYLTNILEKNNLL